MDQTPLPFEYLEGQTYNNIGDRTIWVQGSQSGWDKRQGTIQLTVFADAIPRVKPLVFFRGQGLGPSVIKEKKEYDPRVVVKFNPKAYANEENFLEWIDEQLVPILENQPTLLVLDLFGAHKTQEVLDTFLANDITVSLIPGGCTSLVQPLDVSINRPFKDILKVGSHLPYHKFSGLTNSLGPGQFVIPEILQYLYSIFDKASPSIQENTPQIIPILLRFHGHSRLIVDSLCRGVLYFPQPVVKRKKKLVS